MVFKLPRRSPRRRQKKQFSRLGIALLLICLIALPSTVDLADRVLMSVVPADSGAKADAIVVLGRGMLLRYYRVDIAAELWQDNRAPMIFASGRGDADLIIQQLRSKGIPDSVLAGEDYSRTTEENAQFTAAILQPQGIGRILLVTDSPHMLRSLLTFRALGFTVIPHISPFPPDLDPRKKAFFVFREYAALVSYALLGRFSPNS